MVLRVTTPAEPGVCCIFILALTEACPPLSADPELSNICDIPTFSVGGARAPVGLPVGLPSKTNWLRPHLKAVPVSQRLGTLKGKGQFELQLQGGGVATGIREERWTAARAKQFQS